jgi:hypothetical protein
MSPASRSRSKEISVGKIRVLPVALALGGYVLLAVIGHVLGYLYVRHMRSQSMVLDMYVGRQLSPFLGGFMGDLRVRGLVAWGLGLLVALVVLAVFVLLTSRGGPAAVFSGAWLGSILGSAAGGLVATAIFLSVMFPSGMDGFAQQRSIQYLNSLSHGLYYGAVAGFFVGLAAMLGALGRSTRRTPAETRVA